MRRNLKLVISPKIKENSCKNEYFLIFGVYHFVLGFSHPEMFIVLCMEHSKIRCTRHTRLFVTDYCGAKTVI